MAPSFNLKSRLAIESAISLVVTAVLLFLPAWSLRYWQAWLFLGVIFLPMFVSAIYFYKKDPQLVERRMQTRESVGEQQRIMKVAKLVFLASILIPGFDHHFGWSHVPLWLTILSNGLVLAGYLVTFWVFDTNSFASRTIQVESEQKVISTGPYRFVRHPMYSGGLLMLSFIPLALGSYWALPGFLLLIPLVVLRLLNEEQVLRKQLAGYSEYCLETQQRLIPLVW
jgi:protein-S-isoprenylcysteine O-methyltransferase Ste14